MITNILAQVILSLVTNVTNSSFEMPLDSRIIHVPAAHGQSRLVNTQTQRIVGTNVFERSTIIWVLNGQTNVCSVDRLIYSATQVLRLKETWEAGPITINQSTPSVP